QGNSRLLCNRLHLDYSGWMLGKSNKPPFTVGVSTLVLKLCREFVLNFFVTDSFGSLQTEVDSRFVSDL
ncbi:hypothetical protein J6590_036647, partial [Homalodisca vitripennis]